MSAIPTTSDVIDPLTRLGRLEPRLPPDATAADVVTLQTSAGATHRLHPPGRELVEAARQLVRSRREWLDVPGAGDRVLEMSQRVLRALGLPSEALEHLSGGVFQLTFTEACPPESTAFPWEFALAEVTRPNRRKAADLALQTLLVFRHFEVPNAKPPDEPPKSLLVLVNAPDGIEHRFSFDTERNLVGAILSLEKRRQLARAPLDDIEQFVKTTPPDVVHVAGVDARQGRELLGSLPDEGITDGLVLSDADQSPVVVSYDRFAEALTAGGPPQLVGLNLYNSASGAMAAVRAGVGTAIGFQDEIDDAVAEQFFARFYSEWKRAGWDVLLAFQQAWRAMAPDAERLRATGVVLWSAVPLLSARGRIRRGTGDGRILTIPGAPTAGTAPMRVTTAGGGAPAAGTGTALSIGSGTGDGTDWQAAADPVAIDYEWPQALNYALLHNSENFIPKLVIRQQREGTHRPISVKVAISAGAEEAAYRQTFVVDDDKNQVHNVHNLVRLPLTSRLLRTLDEGLNGTIYTKVTLKGKVLLEETHPLTFRPIDQWQYDDASAKWLPSFIFPRDAAVRRVIASAQRYLGALRDDSAAGFDGYQSVDGKDGDPLEDRAETVDAQVQAIWWALVTDYGLGYINPPPSYVTNAQRLRTPSEVIDGNRGTCIDLALLFAACLEYVEIYPVIFMLNDHAFPGYWRTAESRTRLGQLSVASGSGSADAPRGPVALRESHDDPWMTGRARFTEVTTLVAQGHLIPLETVNLTSRGSFWQSVSDGTGNLRSKRQFYALYDLQTARDRNVTPLPLRSERA